MGISSFARTSSVSVWPPSTGTSSLTMGSSTATSTASAKGIVKSVGAIGRAGLTGCLLRRSPTRGSRRPEREHLRVDPVLTQQGPEVQSQLVHHVVIGPVSYTHLRAHETD